jgi:hypothetical protein
MLQNLVQYQIFCKESQSSPVKHLVDRPPNVSIDLSGDTHRKIGIVPIFVTYGKKV